MNKRSNIFYYSVLGTLFFLFCSNTYAQQSGVIDELLFTGNKKTKASFLYRIAKVKVGQSLDSLKIKTDVDRLKRLDGIAHVTYEVKNSEKGGYVVTYDFKENFSIIPGLRIGEANDESFSLRASLFEFNGLGRNIIFGGFYQKEVFDSFGFFIEHPYLFTNKLGLGFNYQDLTTQEPIYFSDRQINYTYTRKGPEATLFYEHNFNNRFELGGKVFKEKYLLLEGDPENEGLTRGDVAEPSISKSLLRGSYEYVNFDLEYHQQSGFRNLIDVQYFIGGEGVLQTEYIISNTSQYFKRIGSKGNWASQLQLSFSNPVSNTVFVPLVIDNQLNTRGVGNTEDRGTKTIALNTEYRHTLIEKKWFVLQSNTFLDLSALQRPNEDFGDSSNETFRVYPGVGVRFIHKRIFNAVIRLDYGVNVSGQGDASGLVFGIGQFF